MPDTVREDVQTGSSPVPDVTLNPVVPSSAGQSDVATQEIIGDRPALNLKAEFDRKFEMLQRGLADLQQAVLSRQAPAPVTPPSGQTEYTDPQLLDLARQGSNEAYQMYTQRQVQREIRQQAGTQARVQTALAQVNILVSKYPVLRDPSHRLTQTAVAAKGYLIQSGKPDDYGTLAEAIMVAIADNPEIVSELTHRPAQAREAGRQSAVSGNQGEGVSHRATPSRAPVAVPPSAQVLKMAKQMGVKDVGKVQERFLKRNAEKRSSMTPTVSAAMDALEGK